MTIITTRRLTLRPLIDADAHRIALLAGLWEIASMTGRIPYPYSETQAYQWISDLAEGEVVLGIEHQGQFIGICGYTPWPGRSAEIGYWIGKPFWGQGFATEAARALIAHAFTKAGMRRVTCGHFVDNPQSAGVIRKLGFRPTGSEPIWCEARKTYVDALHFEQRRPFTAFLKQLAS